MNLHNISFNPNQPRAIRIQAGLRGPFGHFPTVLVRPNPGNDPDFPVEAWPVQYRLTDESDWTMMINSTAEYWETAPTTTET